ncbi:MAG: hypothetical protein ACR2KE_08845 [Candidatus Nanopelagicales bacterium]
MTVRASLSPVRTRIVAAAVSMSIATTGLVVAAASAQAMGVGAGRAIIRIDSPAATVVKRSDGSYRLVLPQGASGQWLGERTSASGKTTVRVGDVTAEKLSKRWSRFRYTSSGTLATLTWNSSTQSTSGVLIRMDQPKIVSNGVSIRFKAISGQAIPRQLKDASLNIRRAAKSVRTDYPPMNLSADLWYSVDVDDPSSKATGRIYNETNDNTCWSKSMTASTTDTSAFTKQIPSNTCDNIAYYDGVATTLFPNINGDGNGGESWLDIWLTPPQEASFEWNQLVASWYYG